MGVVRHVQHQNRLARHDLEAPRQLHHGQTVAHRLGRDGDALAQGVQRSQHTRGVDQLVGPAQGRVGHAAVAAVAPGPGPLLLVARKIEIAAKLPEVGPHDGSVVDHALRRHRVAHDHRPTGPHDARLLKANAFAVFAQNGGVVDVDAGDHRAIGVMMFTASRRPPKPTSKIATSRLARAIRCRIASVLNSK